MNVIRVLVVDDQELMRDGLIAVLERQPGIVIVGAAAHGLEALEKLAETAPDVILMDVRMPVMDGIRTTIAVRQRRPETRVLMLTTFDDDEYVVEALKAGAMGYILKNIPTQELTEAIAMAYKGIVQLDSAAAAKVVARLSSESAKPVEMLQNSTLLAKLSDREREVMMLVANGANNREIAEQLVISEGTVKSHISNILANLGLRDRTQIAVFVHRLGKL